MADVEYNQAIEVRADGSGVVMEPPEVNGVRGFTVRMSPERAKQIGYRLVGLSTQLLAPSAGKKLEKY